MNKDDGTMTSVNSEILRQIAMNHGADDAGLVEIGHPGLDDQRADILKFYPKTKSLLAVVCRMNREPIRNPARSVANLEFHASGEAVNEVCRSIVKTLEQQGIPAINPPMGFPMEADRWPEKMWVVSHKPVAVAAGLGMMGIHRNVIHPKFGNFILLGTVLIGMEASEYDKPIDYNPCLTCKLCVAACPVGAISPDGHFDMASCYTHNYKEFWVVLAIGSSPLPIPEMVSTYAGKYLGRKPFRHGKASLLGQITKRPIASPSAPQART